MTSTCPSCRHVLEGPEGLTLKCPNCGERVTLKGAEPAVAAGPAPAPVPPVPKPAVALAPAEQLAGPTVRPASTVALVLSLLFFIPLLTQVAAVVVGLVAVCRRRQEHERVAAAWVGIVLAVVVLAVWVFVVQTAWVRARMFTPGGFVFPGSYGEENSADPVLDTGQLAEQLERVQRAAWAYRRDFASWPLRVDSLIGHSLPRGFRFCRRLEYRPPPEEGEVPADWVLALSEVVSMDREGKALPGPRKLILRLDGRIELVTPEEAEVLLASQGAGPPPP